MKIACLSGKYPNWSEQFISRDLKALANLGHEIIIWPCEEKLSSGRARWTKPDGELLPPVIASSLKTKGTFSSPALSALYSCGLLQVRRAPIVSRAVALLPFEPDLVWSLFGTLPAVIGHAISKCLSLPHAVSIHARDVWSPWTPGQRALSMAQSIICCNEAAMNEQARIMPELHDRLGLVHHGLPEEYFNITETVFPEEKECATILAAGRFVKKKGFDTLINAFTSIYAQGVKARLVLVGEGPEENNYRNMKGRSGLPKDSITLRRRMKPEDIAREVARADIIAIPSTIAPDGDRDGIPNILLEAMACGKPVVCCRSGGIPEVVSDGESGLLVAPDSAQEFANALMRVLKSPGLAANLGKKARESVRKGFKLTETVSKLAEILKNASKMPVSHPFS
ncbi:MAG: glycosyltransferase family 4 protein [Planctomycetes bacterium]|nr:glycosyltransferase family 4 protein [Planctomycetota bacterium]